MNDRWRLQNDQFKHEANGSKGGGHRYWHETYRITIMSFLNIGCWFLGSQRIQVLII